jgi:hypothetical protein
VRLLQERQRDLSVRAVKRGAAAVGLALSVFASLSVSAGPASADPITGGCTGTVNGVDAAGLTSDEPLVVREGEQLRVEGDVPPEHAAANPVSSTTIEVAIVDGVFGVTTDEQTSTGAHYSARETDIDDYLQFGVGLYRVDVVNAGENWRCEYTGYIQLDGDTLSKPAGLVALGAIVIGAIGLLLVKGRMPREPGWIDGGLGTTEQIVREEAWQTAGAEYPNALDFEERSEHRFIMPSEIKPNERVVWAGKVRIYGRPVAGFFWGLLLGLGIGVLGWQDARWTVNPGSVGIFPLVVAVVSALVAWLGWGYRIRDVVVLPPEYAPAPEAMATASPDGSPPAPAAVAAIDSLDALAPDLDDLDEHDGDEHDGEGDDDGDDTGVLEPVELPTPASESASTEINTPEPKQ